MQRQQLFDYLLGCRLRAGVSQGVALFLLIFAPRDVLSETISSGKGIFAITHVAKNQAVLWSLHPVPNFHRYLPWNPFKEDSEHNRARDE